MAYDENAQKINLYYLIELSGGNIFEAIKFYRRFKGVGKVVIAITSLERFLIDELIEKGFDDENIAQNLEVSLRRVKQRRDKCKKIKI